MDTLACILLKVGSSGVVDLVGHISILHRCSLYVDDVVLFLSPSDDIHAHLAFLRFFGEATGLKTNVNKCTTVPINFTDQTLI